MLWKMRFNKNSDSQAAIDVEGSDGVTNTSDEYEPHDQLPPAKSASYVESLFILIKATLGTGILGMPRAFYTAGYVLGAVGTLFAGILTTGSMILIGKSEHELCRRKKIPRMTYPETMEAAFELGPGCLRRLKGTARFLTTTAIVMLEFGTDCAYAIFIAVNIKEICEQHFSPAPLRFYLLCLLGPLIVMCWVRNLKYLAPGSTLGSFCAVGCVAAVYYYIFSQPMTLEGKKAVGSVRDFSLFFGQLLFALGAFGVVVPLKNKMTRPAQYGSVCGVVNAATIPDIFLYAIIGVFGYLAYGENTQNPITLNMPQTGIVGDLIRILLACSIFTTYPLCNYVVIEQLWHKNLRLWLGDVKNSHQWEYAFRTIVTCANVLFCILVPSLELVMSLVGSLMVPALGLWFPAIMYTLTFWNEYKGARFALFLLTSIVLTLTGMFALVVSLSTTLTEIYETVI